MEKQTEQSNRKREIKGKQIWKENNMEQKRTQKRTKETEKKKQFFLIPG